ncbi:MAG: NYN domain-containing protein [Pseudomonadota bacterium]
MIDKSPKQECFLLEAFFYKLLQLKNGLTEGCDTIYAREGHTTIFTFLKQKIDLSELTVKKKINELVALGYFEKIIWKGHVTGLKIVIKEWDPARLAKTSAQKVSMEEVPNSQLVEKPAKTFAIFMDYRNLEKGLPNVKERFRDFSWLIDPIVARGRIVFAFVFIPDNYVNRMEIYQLANKHNFAPILCTRQTDGVISKDKDTVDAKMESLACSLIAHTDITNIVIISGDADFQQLANFARWNQKEVTIVSASQAVSGRFLEMAENGSVELILR